ncbi:fatty acid CoA ligase family protein [Aureliella helgolandensis]|uniref:Long-chain-fatty-acid--CoA ligase n=1 Tax=Aureliella helgolandensis TaxID=2527968 RepID=A0A518GH05_9BACT|nr:fatty acid CoA ligase family protein [Aureliella helgolandensis]QDV27864.1 Long-chain-fatty-acid--CoA ligase [Aureliella helgolandensis]
MDPVRVSEGERPTANIAARLRQVAAKQPAQIALASPLGRYEPGRKRDYATMTFADLELHTSSIAAGLQKMEITPGMRIVMLVKFGADFISLVFALLKAGAVVILIDPGMGRKNLVRCLEASKPDGFVAIPAAQLIRMVLRRRFPHARKNVTVGPRYGFLPKPTLASLAGTPSALYIPPPITLDSEAAIIFTTGSTGPPKGVLYTHRTFNSQVDQLVEHYGIKPGGCDLSAFPLFGLFNAVMGTTTVIPDMDPTRPADVDPPRLLDAMDQWKVNQAFGSPVLWTTVGRWATERGRKVESLRRVFSAGAPVSPNVLRWMRDTMGEGGEMFTPYGATESLPVASIESREVLEETADKCDAGAGTCVGRRFSGIEWKVIAIDDGPLASIQDVRELPQGQIGELMVTGDVVTHQYVTRTDQNLLHKVQDGDRIWHRMGDVGYLDEQGRFWCCGRKSHRVRTAGGQLFTEPCEAIFNTHPHVHRSALVGIGELGSQQPVLIAELWPEHTPHDSLSRQQLIAQLRGIGKSHALTKSIEHILLYPKRLPTDIRHNAKIFREQLGPWAAKQLMQTSRRS